MSYTEKEQKSRQSALRALDAIGDNRDDPVKAVLEAIGKDLAGKRWGGEDAFRKEQADAWDKLTALSEIFGEQKFVLSLRETQFIRKCVEARAFFVTELFLQTHRDTVNGETFEITDRPILGNRTGLAGLCVIHDIPDDRFLEMVANGLVLNEREKAFLAYQKPRLALRAASMLIKWTSQLPEGRRQTDDSRNSSI